MFSSWINYYVFGYQEDKKDTQNNKVIIKPEELKSVKLNKKKRKIKSKKIKKPALARYIPKKNFYLLRLSNKHLNEILNVTLKPVKNIKKKTKWENRHPVLRELQQKIKIII